MIDLSVLICSTHTRWEGFGRAIQEQVWTQYDSLPQDYKDRIEILMLTDNKQMMLGHKRNVMVDAAQGRYVQFIDDDDRISPDMFRTILDATAFDKDVITFLVSVSLNGGEPKLCHYSKDFRRDRNTPTEYQRLPNHICVVKRELARQVSFPSIPHGEDSAYSKLLLQHLKTETFIDRILYWYDYWDASSETQQKLPAAIRQRKQPPVADVVILSKSGTSRLRRMTQRTIDSCIAGANSLPVDVTVMEQEPGTYSHATTVHAPEDFNYNAFANRGASRGSAPWIVVANNDLLFHDGWLHHLLAVDHPVVSPKCPRDYRQKEFVENTSGYFTARHFSGWCYMIKRELWQQIGGFDEDVTFWASDDVVIEQVKAVGIMPMLVVDSVVEHLQSVTVRGQANRDDLTWRNIDVFNRKYGPHRLSEHPEFLAWQSRQNQDA
jgi:hypothetical protein